MIRQAPRIPRAPKPALIEYFLGKDVTDTQDIRRSPDMMNCILDDEGTPEMRPGYTKEFATSLGAGAILGIHHWSDSLAIIHHGTKLYTYDWQNAPVEAYDGMAESVSRSYMLGSKLVIYEGTNMIIFDGLLFQSAQAAAYIPTFLIGGDPSGGGTRNEDLNLLIGKWHHTYNTVAGTLTYASHETNLDAVEEVRLNGVILTLTTDYTVNLTAGSITLVADPGATTNGLEIMFRKDSLSDPPRILNCTFHEVFGGPSDSRVFMSGNPNYPHIDWWTQLPITGNFDPTYWPDTNFDRIGGDNEAVVGYAVQYDRMVVVKEDSIYLRGWEITTDGFGRTVTRFPVTILNKSQEGGYYNDEAIAVLENDPVFLSEFGMRRLRGSQVRDERNIEDISPLVKIPASGRAVAIDFGNKYYLAVGDDTVWVCDYLRRLKDEKSGNYVPVWYEWDSMPVNVWYQDGTYMYFGSKTDGMIYRIMNPEFDQFPYNDDGAAINSTWGTIFSTFDRDDLTKFIRNIVIQQKKSSRSEINVEYFTEEGASGNVHTERVVLIDFGDIDFSDFSFDTSRVPLSFRVDIEEARGVQTFKLQLTSSGVADEFFGFTSISLFYRYLTEVRFDRY